MKALLLIFFAAAQDGPTQIHLGYGADASTEMVVMWRTSSNTNTHQVRYGTTAALGSTASGTSAAAPNGASGYIHTVKLTGLQPGTIYHYSCGDATAGWSATRTFRTAPNTPTPLVVATYGDVNVTTAAKNVQSLVKIHNPDLVLILGDLSYSNGQSPSKWDDWFNQLQVVADHVPHMPTIGNHETYGGDLPSYFGRFALPNNERWYSFRAGDVHFVAIDCMSSVAPGSAQYDWLTNDLAQAVQSQVRWKIAFFHYAPYTSGTAHPTDGNAIRTHLSPLFDAYHVDLALAGHVHNYERSHAVLEGGVLDPSGTVHLVVGTGGTGVYTGWLTQPAWSAYRAAWHGFAKLNIDSSLTIRGIRVDGVLMDQSVITKPPVDTAGPVVTIVAPANGSALPSTPVPVKVKARDLWGVAKVEFRVDGTPFASSTLAPYQATLDPVSLALGSHVLEVRAYDAAGNVSTSTIQVLKTSPVTLIAKKATWKYHDLGQDLGTPWRGVAFADAAWSSGTGVLGYGESYVNTTISYGSSSTDKHRTAYFRKSFPIDDPSQVFALRLRTMVDDGFVAYLNGQEIARANMPAGTIGYSSLASSTIEAGNAYVTRDVPKSALVTGTNVLAVEVHQSSASSSDLIFDAELVAETLPKEVAVAGSVETTPAEGGGGGGGCGMLGIEAALLLALGLRRRRA